VQFREYDGLKLLPPFDEDDERAPALAVAHWRDAITPADALLFATPEYNSSIPGQLKNAVDWASRPVNDARLKDKDAVLELDGILIELLYSALQRRVA
jgi:chromate reductase